MNRLFEKLRAARARVIFWRSAAGPASSTTESSVAPLAPTRSERAPTKTNIAARAAKANPIEDKLDAAAPPSPLKPSLLSRLKNLWSRKAIAVADEADASDSPSNKGLAAMRERPSKIIEGQPDSEGSALAIKPSLFTRLRNLWPRKNASVADAATTRPDAIPAAATRRPDLAAEKDGELDATPEVKQSRLRRLFNRLRPTKTLAPSEDDTDVRRSAMDEAGSAGSPRARKDSRNRSRESDDLDENAESEAQVAPGRFAKVRVVFTKKRVWIPGSIAMIALISLGLTLALRARNHVQVLPVAATKAKPAKAPVAAIAAATPEAQPSLTSKAEDTPPVEKKSDPAFEIVGHVKPKPETTAGIDEGDCVVKDKTSVSENLKNCITQFNNALAKPSLSTKGP